MLCNQGPINIEGGQSVRETLPGSTVGSSRPSPTFRAVVSRFLLISLVSEERYHALTSSSRGARTCRATYETSNYAKTRSDTNDGYTRSITRITTIALFAFDRPAFFLSPNRDKRPISDKLTPPSGRCLSEIAKYQRRLFIISALSKVHR